MIKELSFTLRIREENNCMNIIMHALIGYNLKPRSHSAGMAPVHPGGGQPVYRDEPGHFS